MFRPLEKVSDPILVTLIFSQIVQDAFSETCIRFSRDEKQQLRHKLGTHALMYMYNCTCAYILGYNLNLKSYQSSNQNSQLTYTYRVSLDYVFNFVRVIPKPHACVFR